jgi:hypothetical protein
MLVGDGESDVVSVTSSSSSSDSLDFSVND